MNPEHEPSSSPKGEPADLLKLYVEQTTKLGAICAAVGLTGEEDARTMGAKGRKLVNDRRKLLSASEAVLAIAKPSLGQVFILPTTLHLLETAVTNAKT